MEHVPSVVPMRLDRDLIISAFLQSNGWDAYGQYGVPQSTRTNGTRIYPNKRIVFGFLVPEEHSGLRMFFFIDNKRYITYSSNGSLHECLENLKNKIEVEVERVNEIIDVINTLVVENIHNA